MSPEQAAPVPAGWYPDPHGIGEFRWWDSTGWTESIHPPAVPPPAPDLTPVADAVPSHTDSLPSRRELRERGGEVPVTPLVASTAVVSEPAANAPVASEPVLSEPVLSESVLGEPTLSEPGAATSESDSSIPTAFDWLTGSSPASDPTAPEPAAGLPLANSAWHIEPSTSVPPAEDLYDDDILTKTSTTSGWLIALMPLIAGILAIGAVKGAENYPRYVPPAATWWMLAGGVIVLLYFATLLLAAADRRKLDNSGHSDPAHWAWALLTAPIYLLVRTIAVRRETARTSVLLGVWIVLTAALVGGYFLADYFAPELIAGYALPFL